MKLQIRCDARLLSLTTNGIYRWEGVGGGQADYLMVVHYNNTLIRPTSRHCVTSLFSSHNHRCRSGRSRMARPRRSRTWRLSLKQWLVDKAQNRAPTARRPPQYVTEALASAVWVEAQMTPSACYIMRMSFLVLARIKIHLKYVLLNGYGLKYRWGICIYKGSFLHSYLSFEIRVSTFRGIHYYG